MILRGVRQPGKEVNNTIQLWSVRAMYHCMKEGQAHLCDLLGAFFLHILVPAFVLCPAILPPFPNIKSLSPQSAVQYQ